MLSGKVAWQVPYMPSVAIGLDPSAQGTSSHALQLLILFMKYTIIIIWPQRFQCDFAVLAM